MRKFIIPVICMVLCFNAITFSSASADPFIGEIRIFAGNFAPRDWAFCNGQLLAISDNPVLYSLLGTNYGGDGVVTFGLPDLRGRVPMQAGSGRYLGQTGGQEQVTLNESQIPAHTHTATLMGNGEDENQDLPAAGDNTNPSRTMTTSSTGGGAAHSNVQPYIVAYMWRRTA